jgi:polar amino acid transport system permease protein
MSASDGAAPPPGAERDALATAGLFCAVVGIGLGAATVGALWFVSFPLAVAGAAFGRRGMRRAAAGEVARGRGVALAAYVLGLAGVAMHVVGLVVGAIFFDLFEDLDVFFEQYFNFEVIGDNFGDVLEAFWVTIQLALIGAALALVWGLVLALLRLAPGAGAAPVRWLAIAYIDLFRGVPLLLVVLLISGSFPFLTFLPDFISRPDFLGKESIFWYGILSLMLTYGAYYAEVYRAGIEAVPRGQTEAARSLGMSYSTSLRHVIVPQAVRKVIPPMLNDFIALMKDTSLIQVIGVVEAVRAGFEVQATEFNSSALTLAAVLFILVTIPLARIVDRQLARQQIRFQRG